MLHREKAQGVIEAIFGASKRLGDIADSVERADSILGYGLGPRRTLLSKAIRAVASDLDTVAIGLALLYGERTPPPTGPPGS